MKQCELCKGLGRMYCESDNAVLCWDCDAKVHSANFLAARHSRSLLCHVCQSTTPWSASGAKLGPTLSVCERCLHPAADDGESFNDIGCDSDEDDEEEIDSSDIQVVPWSSTPPPPSSSSSERSLKRSRQNDLDLHSDEESGGSSCHRKVKSVKTNDATAVVDSYSTRIRTPSRSEATRRNRLTSPAIMEFIMRNNRTDDSRTLDLESSETS